MVEELSTFDFSRITEAPDLPANEQQRELAYLRYRLADGLLQEDSAAAMLDVGCGSGHGMALLAREGRQIVGGDFDPANVRVARSNASGCPVVRLNANSLPFADDSFDMVLCAEALYYFPDVQIFVAEANRVLRPQGLLIVTVPNPARPFFSPSPGSIAYPTISDLRTYLEHAGLSAQVYGAHSWLDGNHMSRLLMRFARAAAVKLRLIPRSMRGRAVIKRVLYRDMRPLSEPPDAFDIDQILHPVASDSEEVCTFTQILAVGRKADEIRSAANSWAVP